MNITNNLFYKRALKQKLTPRSKYLRKRILDAYTKAGRGHVASYFSLVEIVDVLYEHILKYRPKNPQWAKRDRFILSKGHGALALYAVLSEQGFFPRKALSTFVAFDSMLGQHPDSRKIPGVEASTGALGHGLSIGVGMAIAAKIDRSNSRVFVVISDAECQEGSIWEAALAIHKHKLTNLFTIVDYNHMQSYGSSHVVLDLEPFATKWKSFGFSVIEINGHDVNSLKKTFQRVITNTGKPTVIICHTVKGKGILSMENNMDWHHKTKISPEEIEKLYKELSL